MKLMKHLCVAAGLIVAMSAAAKDAARKPEVCWLETSTSTLDAAMGGDGITETKTWDSTISAILVKHAKGDVLIDAGFGPNAEAQMNELPPAARDFGTMIVSGAKDRRSIGDLLAAVSEPSDRIARILITHAHYDHLGGATELSAPVYVAPAEAAWLESQVTNPIITPPSLITAIKPRLKTVAYNSGPFLGFDKSADIYGDGTIVVVPLPGHTPGSQGVFLKLGKHRVFLIGDAANLREAAERGLPKNQMIRAATDFEPELADREAKSLSAFHRAHPEIALIPAHDRVAYVEAFGAPSACATDVQAHR